MPAQHGILDFLKNIRTRLQLPKIKSFGICLTFNKEFIYPEHVQKLGWWLIENRVEHITLNQFLENSDMFCSTLFRAKVLVTVAGI